MAGLRASDVSWLAMSAVLPGLWWGPHVLFQLTFSLAQAWLRPSKKLAYFYEFHSVNEFGRQKRAVQPAFLGRPPTSEPRDGGWGPGCGGGMAGAGRRDDSSNRKDANLSELLI